MMIMKKTLTIKKGLFLLLCMLTLVQPLLACQHKHTVIDTTGDTHPAPTINQDSLTLLSANWQIDTLDGIILKRVHLNQHNLFGANQYICMLEIPQQSPYTLAFCYEPRLATTSRQARNHDAIAAINGTYFDMDHYNPICFLRINGQQVGENTPGKTAPNRKYYQYGTLILQQGRPQFLIPDSNRRAEEKLTPPDIMTAGPLLLHQGKAIPMRDDRTFVTHRHNRTAIATRADSTIVLFTVDGRTPQSAGMSLTELIQTLQWLGCTNALNLDGGGSTTLYVKGQPYQGIVNYPSDNGRFDHQGERPVSSCILVKRKH